MAFFLVWFFGPGQLTGAEEKVTIIQMWLFKLAVGKQHFWILELKKKKKKKNKQASPIVG